MQTVLGGRVVVEREATHTCAKGVLCPMVQGWLPQKADSIQITNRFFTFPVGFNLGRNTSAGGFQVHEPRTQVCVSLKTAALSCASNVHASRNTGIDTSAVVRIPQEQGIAVGPVVTFAKGLNSPVL